MDDAFHVRLFANYFDFNNFQLVIDFIAAKRITFCWIGQHKSISIIIHNGFRCAWVAFPPLHLAKCPLAHLDRTFIISFMHMSFVCIIIESAPAFDIIAYIHRALIDVIAMEYCDKWTPSADRNRLLFRVTAFSMYACYLNDTKKISFLSEYFDFNYVYLRLVNGNRSVRRLLAFIFQNTKTLYLFIGMDYQMKFSINNYDKILRRLIEVVNLLI